MLNDLYLLFDDIIMDYNVYKVSNNIILVLDRDVMLCYVMLCYVMLCYVMLCYVMLCYVMLCYVMLCYVMLCYVMLCYSAHSPLGLFSGRLHQVLRLLLT